MKQIASQLHIQIHTPRISSADNTTPFTISL